jgi:hypothetical protein
MSIDTVLLILILTFGFGFVLNRWDMRLSFSTPTGGLTRRAFPPLIVTEQPLGQRNSPA